MHGVFPCVFIISLFVTNQGYYVLSTICFGGHVSLPLCLSLLVSRQYFCHILNRLPLNRLQVVSTRSAEVGDFCSETGPDTKLNSWIKWNTWKNQISIVFGSDIFLAWDFYILSNAAKYSCFINSRVPRLSISNTNITSRIF